MNIGTNTLNILKNFSNINSSVVLTPGKVIRTIATSKNIYATATIEETFEREIGIYDLNKFLSTISLFKDPDFEFGEKSVIIKSSTGPASIQYYYSDVGSLPGVKAPERFTAPKHQVEFNLNTKDFAELNKASNVLQAPDVVVSNTKDGRLEIKVHNKTDSTSHQYLVDVGENTQNVDFKAFLKNEYLKFIPGDYNVKISNKNVSIFTNTGAPITYVITLEADSSWAA